MKTLLIPSLVLAAVLAAPLALAKLPPLSAEAQIKADEAKAKAAWTDKVGAYKLCLATDRVADVYYKTAKSAGKETRPPVATAPCADPGPYAAAIAPAAASSPKPLEASGAHSPAATVTSPPGSKATEAQLDTKKK
ncbi:MAG TPA: hypothetical protein VGE16_15235 [Albitalea sp.]